MRNKTILIPGWMNTRGMYENDFEVLEIWQNEIEPQTKLDADWIIGHSVSCNWALLNWKENQKNKLILVNPLLPKRSLITWFFKWIHFHLKETPPPNKEVVKGFRKKIFGIKQIFKLLKYNYTEILKLIPKEKIIVISGINDMFYMDAKARKYLAGMGIKNVDVPSGHVWNEKIVGEIKKIISE